MAKKDHYFLVCAPAGSGLSVAVEKLSASLQEISPSIRIDIEKTLCELEGTRDALRLRGLQRPSGMYEVTWYLARSEITALWRTAARRAMQQVEDSNHRFRLLSCHLTYFGGRRTEFYSPIDASLFSREGLTPSHVVLLIDDVYDMYARLTGAGTLFAPSALLQGHLSRLDSENMISQSDLSTSINVDICAQWKATTITQLLVWRNHESLAAERLARELGAKFLVWGSKQITSALREWIVSDSSLVYLSHPISRPRRMHSLDGQWPPVVEEFNSLQAALVDYGLTCIMPSAIDEYRIQKEKRREGRNHGLLTRRTPTLGPRWPLPSEGSGMLYEPPTSSQDTTADHTHVLSLETWNSKERELQPCNEQVTEEVLERVDVVLQGIENQIQFQIASRDHLFVALTPGLLVYRPLFATGEYSAGVEAEVVHWSLIAKAEQKRIVFVHFQEDIDSLLRFNTEEERQANREQNVLIEAVELVSEKEGVSKELIQQAINSNDATTRTGILDQGRLQPGQRSRINKMVRDHLPQGEEIWQSKMLRLEYSWECQAPEELRPFVKTIVVLNATGLKQQFSKIAAFLRK